MTVDRHAAEQLAALRDVGAALDRAGIDHWLFGGWAVDFYAGAVTRPHDDVDLAVWLEDVPRTRELLDAEGWRHAPEPDEDGGTGYERGGIRLELTFLVRGRDGATCIPLRAGLARWGDDVFADDRLELEGVRARVISLSALRRGKSAPRDDPDDAAKDRSDFDKLAGL